jgi:hypothetical protein
MPDILSVCFCIDNSVYPVALERGKRHQRPMSLPERARLDLVQFFLDEHRRYDEIDLWPSDSDNITTRRPRLMSGIFSVLPATVVSSLPRLHC